MAKLTKKQKIARRHGRRARSSTASTRRSRSSRATPPPSSTRRSRSRSTWASIRATPTRWSAASSSLPTGTGKDVRVAVFAKGDKAEEATDGRGRHRRCRGPDGDMQGGKIDFDRVIATPDMMGIVGRLGKVLGPKGLMPNPKLGTVTPNVAEAVKAAKGGQVEFRVEKAGIIHAGIGKASFPRSRPQGQFRRLRRCHRQGQADRRQGQVCQEGRGQLDDGPGRQDRPRRGRRRLVPASLSGIERTGAATLRSFCFSLRLRCCNNATDTSRLTGRRHLAQPTLCR